MQYLLDCDEQFDYIDITNILLFAYQLDCDNDPDKFNQYVKNIKQVYDKNLREKGSFVLDYVFGMGIDQIKNDHNTFPSSDSLLNDKTNKIVTVNRDVYSSLEDYFALESFDISGCGLATPISGNIDTVIYTKK